MATLIPRKFKPFSTACEQNRDPILEVLREAFADRTHVLEIASGTGQHAVYFGAALPQLQWQTSDRRENLKGIQCWVEDTALPNVHLPLEIDVNNEDWLVSPLPIDAIFCANAVHIMNWPSVEKMFQGIGRVLGAGAVLCLYGPFNYNGKFTSESNQRFDEWLKMEDEGSGVRDFEAIDALARAQGFTLVRDTAMPANNRLLWWKRGA